MRKGNSYEVESQPWRFVFAVLAPPRFASGRSQLPPAQGSLTAGLKQRALLTISSASLVAGADQLAHMKAA